MVPELEQNAVMSEKLPFSLFLPLIFHFIPIKAPFYSLYIEQF